MRAHTTSSLCVGSSSRGPQFGIRIHSSPFTPSARPAWHNPQAGLLPPSADMTLSVCTGPFPTAGWVWGADQETPEGPVHPHTVPVDSMFPLSLQG